MEDYNIWADLLDTYQSTADWIQALWLVVPPAFLFGLIALILRYRIASKQAENGISGDLAYTIHRDGSDLLHIYRHGREGEDHPARAADRPGETKQVSGDTF